MNTQPSPAPPIIPASDFDLSNMDLIDHYLGSHFREEDDFKAYAQAQFPGTLYKDLTFRPYPKGEVLNMLHITPGTPGYKPYKEYLVRVWDTDCTDNDQLTVDVILKKDAEQLSCYSYFPLLLFICIMEFYKVTTPGDQIKGDIEFSWGKRKNLRGKWVITVIFRFQLVDDSWQFYDYSSEYPTAFLHYLQTLKNQLMNA